MAPLTITILGASPSAPNTGGACSSYLLRQGETSVLMDCGPGSAGRIALHVPVNSLTAIVISHFHPDHYFDLVQLYYLLLFGEPRAPRFPRLVPLWTPPGGREFLNRLGLLIADRQRMLEDVFAVAEYSPGPGMDIGGLNFTFHPVQHYIPSHAMRVVGADGGTLVFSSDVAPCQQLIEAARGADLFLCESALLDLTQDNADPVHRGHLTAAEAGAAATAAGVRSLLLTHCRQSSDVDPRHLAAARQSFSGPLDLAREGQTYTLPASSES